MAEVVNCRHCRWMGWAFVYPHGVAGREVRDVAVEAVQMCGRFAEARRCSVRRERYGGCGLEGRYFEREPGSDDEG